MFQSKRFFSHVPVMAEQVVKLMKPENGKVFIDMTFGGGGHTRCLLNTNKSITVVAVDRDPVAFQKAKELASKIAVKSEQLKINQRVIPIHGKFSTVMKQIHLHGVPYGSVDGVLFDLGASSMQYDDADRGFALSRDGPLDMRMDTSNDLDIKAEDVVNNLGAEDLSQIFKTYGEERRSRKVTNAILDARALIGRIRTTQELARIISSSGTASIDGLSRHAHPGTKVFQALRIFVNNELNELNYALKKIREFLKHEAGIAVVLTFHSLEDRIVKFHFSGIDSKQPTYKRLSQHDRIRTRTMSNGEQEEPLAEPPKEWSILMKHVETPDEIEIAVNPRSRSAKLRAAIRAL